MSTKPLPKSLQEFVAKYPDKFEEGWTEADYAEGDNKPWSHWVYLKPGYANTAVEPWGGMHIIHESTIREVKRQLRLAKRCECEDCQKEKAT